jgi:hypothetical protein
MDWVMSQQTKATPLDAVDAAFEDQLDHDFPTPDKADEGSNN